ncbi:YrhK family protein [Cardiobacteriaceae bacterium TAE3-ERU3]|nr:YrhK family protein [Cardiobacteriaceae bacterium TAE3-ERU3]
MPHLVTARPRLFHPVHNERWFIINAFMYKFGGVVFVIGSVLFLPYFSAYVTTADYLFFIGSLCYLLVTGHDLRETRHYWQVHPTRTNAMRIELLAVWCYFFGSILFTIGSLCFLPQLNLENVGAWLFIIGSLLFIVGACANFMQLIQAPDALYIQLYNFTLVTFIVGSVLFLFMTVPYLQSYDAADTGSAYNLAATGFIIGSILFLLGGIFIYLRYIKEGQLTQHAPLSSMERQFIAAVKAELPTSIVAAHSDKQ